MGKDDQRVTENVELGSLARDSEKIRLKQADERASALAPLTQSTQLGPATAADKLMTGGRPSGPKYGSMPGGIWFVMILIAICFSGGAVQVQRASVVSGVADLLQRNISSETYILTQIDLAQALQKQHQYLSAEAKYNSLIQTLTGKYGKCDQRVALAKLELASFYLDTDREKQIGRASCRERV